MHRRSYRESPFADMVGQVSTDIQTLAKTGISDFDGMVAVNPDLQANWLNIVKNMQADAVNGIIAPSDLVDSIQGAGQQMYATFQKMYGDQQVAGSDNAFQWVDAASNLVGGNFTSSGAARMVNGLIQLGIGKAVDAAEQPVQDAVKSMTGSLFSSVLGSAAGGLMASGVGAAVGVGLSVVGSFLSGLFGSPPPPPYSVGSCGMYNKPNRIVKYVWFWGNNVTSQPVNGGPNNIYWLNFPEPPPPLPINAANPLTLLNAITGEGLTAQQADDAPWFQRMSISPSTSKNILGEGSSCFGGPTQQTWNWSGSTWARGQKHQDQWTGCFTYPIFSCSGGDTGKRPIDQAMYDIGTGFDSSGNPQNADEVSIYRNLEVEQTAPIIAGIPQNLRSTFQEFQHVFFNNWKRNRELQLNGIQPQPDWNVLAQTIVTWNRSHSPTTKLNLKSTGGSLIDPQAPPFIVNQSTITWLIGKYGPQLGQQVKINNDGSVTLNMGAVHPIAQPTAGIQAAGSLKMIAANGLPQPAPKLVIHMPPLPSKPAAAIPATALLVPTRTMLVDGVLLGSLLGLSFAGPIGLGIGGTLGLTGHFKNYPQPRRQW
jgi:hypothetical protein